MTRERKILGDRGEGFAVSYLKRRGYRILERNFRCQLGEIDIVAKQGRDLVFVEVKTRTSSRFGHPAEAVTEAKQVKLRQVASCYLQRYERDIRCRFDVLAVLIEGDTINATLIKNAF